MLVSMLSMLRQRTWQQKPVRTSLRVATSLIRKQIHFLRETVVSYDDGRSKIHARLDSALGLTLYRYGIDDPDIQLVRRLLNPGDVFVDGGANIGLYTLAAAARVGAAGRVIAFEPAGTTRELLRRNVELNHFDWVDIRDDALSEKSGTLDLTVFEGNGAGLSSFRPATSAGGRTERVRTLPLDDALGGISPNLVKLDLEGAEHAALLGARSLLRAKRAAFFLELESSHLERQGASAHMVIELLETAGYELFSVGRLQGDVVVARGVVRRATGTPNVLAVPNCDLLADARVSIVEGALFDVG